ncbi:hypothetical protein [Roseivivax sediminis]|uniref:Uncharacterized protein n=1 Tax=Roseivivax sediminis TaxID=936889 RepID=A0A1I1W1H9_9RHOB|nr:hypothetical protein [Roseivivax sediminis]SFD88228.1 hypothetical protein SAMN04515678_10431 [Roseivivax sediminis]
MDERDKDEKIRKLSEENAELNYKLADKRLEHFERYSRVQFLLEALFSYIVDEPARRHITLILNQMDADLRVGDDKPDPVQDELRAYVADPARRLN